MRRRIPRRAAAPVSAALAALLVTAGCGDVGSQPKGKTGAKPQAGDSASPSPGSGVDTSAGESDWLLGLTTVGGADGETSSTVYLTYNPSTGAASARKLPGVQAASSPPEQAALLISSDRSWAIPDTGISRSDSRSGRLKVYSLAGDTTKVLDIRARTGRADVKAIGWAFDPLRTDTLRVVDTKNRVWAVKVSGGRATQERSLPKGPWVFTNGFNRNTGQPWVESIDSDRTRPPGNGPSDTTVVTRDGGTVLPSGSAGLGALPASPCRLGGGFTDVNGVTWTFCADSASVSTYYLPQGGDKWVAYGKASTAVAPTAAGLPLVLPPSG